jgi:hypothetical protein
VIFVDTSAWYAAYVPGDPRHAELKLLVESAPRRLVTTDHVLAETLTLLRVRGEGARAILLGRAMLAETCADLIRLEKADLERAFEIFAAYADKRWSYVDCSSYAVMERLGIVDAFALDRHFHQMPGIVTRPHLL